MAAKNTADLIQIVRNVTGRVDASDPQFTDPIILGYINDYYRLEMGQEMRLTEQETWWEFTISPTSADPFPVDLQNPTDMASGVEFTTIGPLCYVDGFRCWWTQDPGEFYWKWPETQTYQPSRPTDVLYYNQQLTFRCPPDQDYVVKIQAYAVELEMPMGGNISHDYLWRYISYGAAIDILRDYGEHELADRIRPQFVDYRSKVYARTYQQQMNQRSLPRF